MSFDDYYGDYLLDEDASRPSISIDRTSSAAAWEFLTRVELDVAFTSEKALNLDILLMQVEDMESDYEAPNLENEDLSTDSVIKAFEFDVLSGILNTEVQELDSFVASLQDSISDAEQILSESAQSEEISAEIKEKLEDAEKSLKKTEYLVTDLKLRSAKFENSVAFAGYGTCNGEDVQVENGQSSPRSAKLKLQNEQQRHFLQMLEKSLARELDLEKKFSESRHNEEDLKIKLLYAEQEAYNIQHSMEMVFQRMFETENATETLFGISKELLGKLQIAQFNLKGSALPENKVRSELEESEKKSSAEASAVQVLRTNFEERVAVDECKDASSEALSLRDKVRALEDQLKESNSQLQLAKASVEANQEQQNKFQAEHYGMEEINKGLKEDVLRLESRVESAEEKCTFLTKTNFELTEQLDFLRYKGTEKEYVLERKLKESELQLEHAKASIEAIEEQRSMLYSALSDMEHLIADLKERISKVESRAMSAESKCALLTETNLELNEELGFLRSKLESTEASLNQVEDAKVATAKDICIKTKFIADLLMKLALERERLQFKMSVLAKQNKILSKRRLRSKDKILNNTREKEFDGGNNSGTLNSYVEAGSETANIQVDKTISSMPASETSVEADVLTEGPLSSESNPETVRTIEASQLSVKYMFLSVLVLLVSILAVYLFQLEN